MLSAHLCRLLSSAKLLLFLDNRVHSRLCQLLLSEEPWNNILYHSLPFPFSFHSLQHRKMTSADEKNDPDIIPHDNSDDEKDFERLYTPTQLNYVNRHSPNSHSPTLRFCEKQVRAFFLFVKRARSLHRVLEFPWNYWTHGSVGNCKTVVNELLTYSDIHLVIPMSISMLSLKTTVQPKH